MQFVRDRFVYLHGIEHHIFTPANFVERCKRDAEKCGKKPSLRSDVRVEWRWTEVVRVKYLLNDTRRDLGENWCMNFAVSSLYESFIFKTF